jgi:hypothetical protein
MDGTDGWRVSFVNGQPQDGQEQSTLEQVHSGSRETAVELGASTWMDGLQARKFSAPWLSATQRTRRRLVLDAGARRRLAPPGRGSLVGHHATPHDAIRAQCGDMAPCQLVPCNRTLLGEALSFGEPAPGLARL